MCVMFFFFQAEDGIRDLVRSRGLGDVYKRQAMEGTSGSTGDITVTEDQVAQLKIAAGELSAALKLSLIHI